MRLIVSLQFCLTRPCLLEIIYMILGCLEGLLSLAQDPLLDEGVGVDRDIFLPLAFET